jgi:hypothetical protein
MMFCHAPLPINKKSSIACNLILYYRRVYMSKSKKQDLTPSILYPLVEKNVGLINQAPTKNYTIKWEGKSSPTNVI